VPARGHLAKIFFKKKSNFVERRPGGTRQRIFFKKNKKKLCRVPAGLALGKATVNGAGAVTVAFLCRVPDKRHSAKRSLPINFLPRVHCQVSHSAKNLNPIVIGATPLWAWCTSLQAHTELYIFLNFQLHFKDLGHAILGWIIAWPLGTEWHEEFWVGPRILARLGSTTWPALGRA